MSEQASQDVSALTGECQLAGIYLTELAEVALRAIGKWGYPESALHHRHRRFFHRHSLIEPQAPGRIRTTAKADALLASIGAA